MTLRRISYYRRSILFHMALVSFTVKRSFIALVVPRARALVRRRNEEAFARHRCQMSSSSSSLANTPTAEFYDSQICNHPSVGASENKFDPRKPFFPIYYNDVYEVVLPPKHRFPMTKYAQVRQRLQRWISSLPEANQSKVACDFRVSPLATVEELATTHCPSYIDRFLRGDLTEKELRNVGFPWSISGAQRSLSSVGGTVAAAVSICEALRQRRHSLSRNETTSITMPLWAAHVAGGTHHSFYDYGEGFCFFSDIAVAANVVLKRYPDVVRRILIVDLDVHQGNGNAVLFQGRSDVMTFSIHCNANYFSPKEASDLDVELPPNCADETYLVTLQHWLKQIDSQAGDFDLIFFQSGVDVLKDDRLGRMDLSSDGVKRRNELIFDFAVSRDIPLVITMGGGYPAHDGDWEPILDAHANVYFGAHQYLAAKYPPREEIS